MAKPTHPDTARKKKKKVNKWEPENLKETDEPFTEIT